LPLGSNVLFAPTLSQITVFQMLIIFLQNSNR
jgi:hypothetical protein